MRVLTLYAPIVVAVMLALLFRRTYGVRVFSALILGAIASIHFPYLMASHRLVIDDGVHQLPVAPGGQLPPDFRVAVDSVRKDGQQQLWPFADLTAGFVVLALLPFESMKRRTRNDDA